MSEQVEALNGALEISKAELIAIAKPFYFSHYSGQMAVASALEAKAGDKLVRVGFSNSYRGTTDDAAILRVTGESRNRWDRLRQTALPARSRLLRDARPGGMRINGAAFFKQSFELKIKGDLIPESAAEEIIGELQALFARHNAGAALSAKVVFKPTKEFHTVRHTLYSADENMEIDKVVPAAASGAGFVGVHSSHQTGSIHPLKTTKCRSFSTASYIAREHWLNGQDDSGAVHR